MKQRFELIEMYIDGELGAEEKKYVEDQIASNPEFAREFHLRQKVNSAIMEKDVIQLRNNLEKIYQTQHSDHSGIVRKLFERKWHLAAASATILLVVGSFLLSNLSSPNADQVFSKYYEPESAILMTRSADEHPDSQLKTALHKFEQKDFQGAIPLLIDNKDNILAQFYLGLSYIETKDYKRAISSFQIILDNNNNLFLEQSEWYKGLCYLKLGENIKATDLFTTIKNSNSLYQKDAEDILQKLN